MADIISRSQAKINRLKMYYTGDPCPHGHLSYRYVSNHKCLACCRVEIEARKLLRRERYRTDLEYAELRKRKARAHHLRIKEDPIKFAAERAKKAAYSKSKRATDPVFLEKNRKASRKYKSKWGKEQKEKHRIHARNRKAKMKGAPGRYTISDVRKILTDQGNLCKACSCNLSESGYHVDHVVPIKLGGTNWPDNIQLLCPPCNLSKAAKHPDAWQAEIKMIKGRYNVEG